MYEQADATMSAGPMQSHTSAPQRETEVWGQLNRQEGQVTALQDAVAKLHDRLQSILQSPTKADGGPDRNPPPMTALAQRIAGHTDSVVDATRAIHLILETLEL